MTTEDRIFVGLFAVFAVLTLVGTAWFLPQKWQACQKLYDNRPAQIICLGSR
jgi:hypothetical protein